MSLNIDKAEMDAAWRDRNKSDKFYKFVYDIAKHQVSIKGIWPSEKREEYIQFCVFKCFKHVNSYKPSKGTTYAFFWKQISLAIKYMQRKEARRNSKIKTIYVEQEKVIDWIERNQHQDDGDLLRDIVERDELSLLKKMFRQYNSSHKSKKIEPSKETAIKVLKWHEKRSPGTVDKFTTLKPIFKEWLATQA
jgi:hypothetical protein